jgi:hypothetical protein
MRQAGNVPGAQVLNNAALTRPRHASAGREGQRPFLTHEIGSLKLQDDMLELIGLVATVFLAGFGTGYLVRAMISRHRRRRYRSPVSRACPRSLADCRF